MTTRNNHVIDGRHGPPTERDRAIRRLRDSIPGSIEVVSEGNSNGTCRIENFVMDLSEPGLPDYMFHCAGCDLRVIVYGVKVLGEVSCDCGPLKSGLVGRAL